MTISGGSALAKEEIDRMIRDAEQHADEDRRRREEAETRNTAEQLVWSTEKFVSENEEKLPEDGKTEVREAIAQLKKALEGSDVSEVKAKQENLATVSQRLGAALYAQNAEGGAAGAQPGADSGAGAGAAGGATAADDDVVDAEIVDEDK